MERSIVEADVLPRHLLTSSFTEGIFYGLIDLDGPLSMSPVDGVLKWMFVVVQFVRQNLE
jgi:hypothetical protein